MVGRYGGAAFVLFYIAIVLLIGVPALMAEWALGRETKRGTVGAFERGGLPFGKAIGWFLFAIVVCATAYYTNVIGWVLWFAIAEVARPLDTGGTPSLNQYPFEYDCETSTFYFDTKYH